MSSHRRHGDVPLIFQEGSQLAFIDIYPQNDLHPFSKIAIDTVRYLEKGVAGLLGHFFRSFLHLWSTSLARRNLIIFAQSR
jgi:hypothetical protein